MIRIIKATVLISSKYIFTSQYFVDLAVYTGTNDERSTVLNLSNMFVVGKTVLDGVTNNNHFSLLSFPSVPSGIRSLDLQLPSIASITWRKNARNRAVHGFPWTCRWSWTANSDVIDYWVCKTVVSVFTVHLYRSHFDRSCEPCYVIGWRVALRSVSKRIHESEIHVRVRRYEAQRKLSVVSAISFSRC